MYWEDLTPEEHEAAVAFYIALNEAYEREHGPVNLDDIPEYI